MLNELLARLQINELLARLQIWVDKRRAPRALLDHHSGRFFVIYNTGDHSIRMAYSTARDYCKMFGGVVIHAATGREC